mmetsp:Transcript_1610/g.2250  ORF Transcript_1610/g.2250 Transcript_1610/m.2250 type:complete len:204 (-) Transcript_1610:207-818(-)
MSVRWISRSALVPSEKRRPPMASISSIKMSVGSCSLAYPNISRINRADSPIYLSTIADDTTLRKLAFMLDANPRANNVLPVPGGPYNNTPLGGLIPTRKNNSGLVSGSSTVSRNSRICSFNPPIDDHGTAPGSSLSMLNTTGSTSRGKTRIIVNVVISRLTRVPATNFVFSILFLHPTTYLGPEEALTINRSSSSCRNTSPMI